MTRAYTHTHTPRASLQGTQVPVLVCQLRSHMSVDTLGLSSGGLWCVMLATLAGRALGERRAQPGREVPHRLTLS